MKRFAYVLPLLALAPLLLAGLNLGGSSASAAPRAEQAACDIDVAERGVYYEQAVRVEGWFIAHDEQADHRVGKCVVKAWRALVYNRLIGKWDGVHACEGAWNASGFYDGGLQMDDQFQRTYGREFLSWWGHAGQWPAAYQMVAAERAYQSRGFGPWPVCGAYGG